MSLSVQNHPNGFYNKRGSPNEKSSKEKEKIRAAISLTNHVVMSVCVNGSLCDVVLNFEWRRPLLCPGLRFQMSLSLSAIVIFICING